MRKIHYQTAMAKNYEKSEKYCQKNRHLGLFVLIVYFDKIDCIF